MQIHQVVPVVEIPIAETGRKPRPLRLSTIAECDELIIAVTRAKSIILAAHATIEEAEAVLMVAPQGEHPYPGKIVCNAPGFLPDSWCIHDAMVPHMHEDAQGRKWGVAPVTPLIELPRRNARPDGESREFPYPASVTVADCRERDGDSICVRPKLHPLPHRDEHGREFNLSTVPVQDRAEPGDEWNGAVDCGRSPRPQHTVPGYCVMTKGHDGSHFTGEGFRWQDEPEAYPAEMVCQFHGGTSTEESACPIEPHDAEASQS